MNAFVLLVVQNTGLIFFSSAFSQKLRGQSANIVLGSDLFKLVVSMCGLRKRRLRTARLRRLAPLAAMYAVQTTLLMYALQYVDAPVFQTIQQSKTLLTALLSVYVLGSSLSAQRWAALLALTFGMVMVVTDGRHTTEARLSGVVATLVASLLSAFASVRFERALRNDNLDKIEPTQHLLDTNYHLALVSLPFVAPPVLLQTGRAIDTPLVITAAISGVGGLLVARVTQQSGSLHKCVATAVSIVIGSILSTIFLDYPMTPKSAAGIVITLVSSIVYVA